MGYEMRHAALKGVLSTFPSYRKIL